MATRHRLRRQAPQILGLLDIGTGKTVCLIVAAARHGGAGDVEVLGVGQQASRGLKAGTVIELDAVEQCVRAAVTDAERAAGTELRQVLLAVACGRLKSTSFAADAKIGGRAVTEADIGRLMSASRSYVERDGRALLHLNCVGYRLDGAAGIAAPHGLAGKLLSADLHAVSADAAPLRNLVHAAERAYLSVTGLVPAPYAGSPAATTAEERRAGVVALDFGAGTTGLAVFAEGHLLANDVIPVGGHHITFDIARALQISLAQAERIKAIYGTLDAAARRSRGRGHPGGRGWAQARAGGDGPGARRRAQPGDGIARPDCRAPRARRRGQRRYAARGGNGRGRSAGRIDRLRWRVFAKACARWSSQGGSWIAGWRGESRPIHRARPRPSGVRSCCRRASRRAQFHGRRLPQERGSLAAGWLLGKNAMMGEQSIGVAPVRSHASAPGQPGQPGQPGHSQGRGQQT